MSSDMLATVKEKANSWLNSPIDDASKNEIRQLMSNDEKGLIDAFYKDMEFGTGGMRGIMGVGTNRMNIYTIAMATQGLCNYILKECKNQKEISVAIAYDCRNNSKLFARKAAEIFSANNIKAYLFEDLRPTPELSYAIRLLGCQSGVVVTASHNPKEYNGYKVYWNDGAQVIEPHDENIIAEVEKIKTIAEVKSNANEKLISMIGQEVDEKYLAEYKNVTLSPEAIKACKDIKIVYTPIHGTGVRLVPALLKNMGFTNIFNIPEQDVTDGNFPTVHSPNPEESAALNMAIEKARSVDADIVMASDPDADRVGIAVKNHKNEWVLLNGNQTAAILIYFQLSQWKEKNKLAGREFIVKTIVTTELLAEIADNYKVKYYDVLTGFKYIADIIRKNEGKTKYIGGGEESYGYLPGDFVRDKDAVMTCGLLAEITAWAKSKNKTIFDILLEIYTAYSFYKESLTSVVRKGKEGAEEIQKMMEKFRNNPPESLAGSDVVLIHDYQSGKTYDQISQLRYDITLPKSNVLQFITKDGTKVSVRPSGTEPKIKFYFSVKEQLPSKDLFEATEKKLDEKISQVKKELGI